MIVIERYLDLFGPFFPTLVATAFAAVVTLAVDRMIRDRRLVRALRTAGYRVILDGTPAKTPKPEGDPVASFTPGRPPLPTDLTAIAEVLAEIVGGLVAQIGDLKTYAEGLPIDVWKDPPRLAADEVQKAAEAIAEVQADLLTWASGEVPILSTFDLTGVCVGALCVSRAPDGSPILFPDNELASAMSRGLRDALDMSEREGRLIVVKSTVAFGLERIDDLTP